MAKKRFSFNGWLADKLAGILSSMWLFWLLSVVIIVAAFIQPPVGAYQWVMFVISAAFQAVALPVLAFVSNIQGDKQTKIIMQTNRLAMEELKLIKEQQLKLEKLITNEKGRFSHLDEKLTEIDGDVDSINSGVGEIKEKIS
ncbi:MAG: hypothetical protein LBG64_03065 [Pseudomonadales bacterium]|jgi:hypothetical protein|nr:hypothetical protein [Pseudomonadales bacterium]